MKDLKRRRVLAVVISFLAVCAVGVIIPNVMPMLIEDASLVLPVINLISLVILVVLIGVLLDLRKWRGYYDKLRKWEAEGYDVSELSQKWFPAGRRNRE